MLTTTEFNNPSELTFRDVKLQQLFQDLKISVRAYRKKRSYLLALMIQANAESIAKFIEKEIKSLKQETEFKINGGESNC